jgi:hypothetical protein
LINYPFFDHSEEIKVWFEKHHGHDIDYCFPLNPTIYKHEFGWAICRTCQIMVNFWQTADTKEYLYKEEVAKRWLK